MSLLFLGLAGEVLSRGISKLKECNELKLIKGTIRNYIPLHVLYADNVMIFYTGAPSKIQALSYFFLKYAQIPGQYINPQKSIVFGVNICSLPFIYLGVLIFKGM